MTGVQTCALPIYGEPVYIIAEIASNFDGSKKRAKLLIDLAVNCGADAVKFQCFKADKIISKEIGRASCRERV